MGPIFPMNLQTLVFCNTNYISVSNETYRFLLCFDFVNVGSCREFSSQTIHPVPVHFVPFFFSSFGCFSPFASICFATLQNDPQFMTSHPFGHSTHTTKCLIVYFSFGLAHFHNKQIKLIIKMQNKTWNKNDGRDNNNNNNTHKQASN